MIRGVMLGLLATLLSPGCDEEQEQVVTPEPPPLATVKVTSQKINIRINDSVETTPTAVWRATSPVLKSHVEASRFQISWYVMVLGSGARSTAFYNRKQSTLKYSSVGYDSSGKEFRDCTLYSGVTDAILRRLAEDAGGGSADAGLFLLSLRYGCKSKQLVQ